MENKTIQFNPDLFKIQNKNRRTRKNNVPLKSIKFKNNNHLLKQIRNEQQKNYKNLFENREEKKEKINSSSFDKSDFESSIDFLEKIVSNENTNSKKEETLPESENSSSNNIQVYYPDDSLLTTDNYSPDEIGNSIGSTVNSIPPPAYGNLKNGKKPTYRTLRETQKNKNILSPSSNQLNESINTNIKFKQEDEIFEEKNNLPPPPILNNLKKRKITRRTFRVGKDKSENKVSVLISNKTMRNRNENKAQQLKSVSMTEIYNYLIKKGLIKVSTSAPDNILRQLYESSILTAGEIQNHNLENVLYNYIH